MVNDTPIRVIHIIEAVIGGTKKHLLDLCAGIDKSRFQLQAIVSPIRDPQPAATKRILNEHDVRVHQVPMRRGLSPVSAAKCLPQISRYLKNTQPHIVHTHSTTAGVLGRIAALRTGNAATIYTPHSFPFSMKVAYPMRALSLAAERYLGQRTNRIIAVCESERQTAIQQNIAVADRCITIENGIELTPQPTVNKTRIYDELGLPQDALMLLCVGNLRPQKNHTLAIKALANVLKQRPRAHLVVAGTGKQRNRLEQKANTLNLQDHVHLIGFRDDVPRLLASCDIFLQPSLWEGCPYAVLEAAAAGCPIVATDIPGINDIITTGETGWLSPPDDANSMSRNILKAAENDDERSRRAQNAQEVIRSRYTLQHMIDRTEQVYEEVVAE